MKPMMSGLPSGLRVTLWKTAPAIPNAPPTSSPVSTRGSRSVSTMNVLAGSPRPISVATTCSGESG